MYVHADGVLDPTKPWNAPPNWNYLRPWATNEERLTQQALDAALISPQSLADTVRPPLGQVDLFPPRFGYRRRALSITDVVGKDRIIDQNPAPNFSGGPAGSVGASRYSQGDGLYS
jgi:hypothetical protein